MKYKVEQSNTHMVIHNDMGVRVYVTLKKASNGFNVYPICASIFDKDVGEIDVGESSSNRIVSLVGGDTVVELDDFETRELIVDE